MRTASPGLGIAALVLSLAACTSSGSPEVALPSASAVPSESPCPTPAAKVKPVVWPAGVPADIPKPPTARIFKRQRTPSGLVVVYFRTQTALREGVLFVLKAWPAAGYVLGRGDAEAIEAEAPFARGDLRGMVKLLATQPCETTWLLAVGTAQGGQPNGPVLPGYQSPSASSLPFGYSSP